MEHIFFEPWVGKNYKTGGIFDKKILVLGESHYCGNKKCMKDCGILNSPEGGCEDFTKKMMKKYLAGHTDTWTPTFRKFERSLINDITTLEKSNDIWNSVAFYNFLQIAMERAREGGGAEDYAVARIAFLEVINKLQPDLIIVWGTSRLYYNLPGIKDGWEYGEELEVDGWNVPNGYYQLKNGKKSRVIAVYHPSTGYSWDWWHKVISTEVQVIK